MHVYVSHSHVSLLGGGDGPDGARGGAVGHGAQEVGRLSPPVARCVPAGAGRAERSSDRCPEGPRGVRGCLALQTAMDGRF